MDNTINSAKTVNFSFDVLERGERFMDELLNRARAVSAALKAAGVPHAIIGGLAVRSYEALAEGEPSLTTRDIDMLLRRVDLDRTAAALKPLGFQFRTVNGIPAFLIPGERFRNGIHIVWTGEAVRGNPHVAPDIDETELQGSLEGYQCIDLKRLVFLKLTSFRPKDIAHLQDLVEWGLVTPDIKPALPADLQVRLEQVYEQNRNEGRDMKDESDSGG